MSGFTILFYLFIMSSAFFSMYFLSNIYFKKRTKKHLWCVLAYTGCFFLVLMTIVNYVISNTFHFSTSGSISNKLFDAYFVLIALLSFFFILKYFIQLFHIEITSKIESLLYLVIFSPIAVISFMIALSFEVEAVRTVKNAVLVGVLAAIFLFSIIIIKKNKSFETEDFNIAYVFAVFGILIFPFGVADCFSVRIDFIGKFYTSGFSLSMVIFLVLTLVLLLNNMKTAALYQKTDEIHLLNALDVNAIAKYKISEREAEIIKELASGRTNKEIADKLFISSSTVRTHIYNIFQKTYSKNRVELINLFYRVTHNTKV